MPEPYFFRALAAEGMNDERQAYSDYTRALERNPRYGVAALNRGILSYKAQKFDDAIADFQRVLEGRPDAATAGYTHYNLALSHLAKGDRARAMAYAGEAVALGYKKASDLSESLKQRR